VVEKSFEVLSSPTRLEIYRSLLKGSLDTEELSRLVGLSRSTLRFHLRILESAGLVSHRSEEPKARGRPRIVWEVDREVHITGFPSRHYDLLSDILFRTIYKLESRRERVAEALSAVGREVGRELIERISREKTVARWGPQEFCRYFVKENLEGAGIVSDVERCTGEEAVFSYYNCPFQELATRYTRELCDDLDRGFYQGMVEAMGGGIEFRRTSCIAHGDGKCSYVFVWFRRDDEPRRPVPAAGLEET
jgi:predicted ArsR family transcriptional regulator